MTLDHLFSPVRIGTLELPHRGIMPPMVTNLCGRDGSVTDELIAYHVARARGGVALILAEAAYVHRGGKGFPHQLGIHDDALIPGLRRLTTAVHEAGAKIGVQLYHGGRQASVEQAGGTLVAPSPIACQVVKVMPHELTVEEIGELVVAFVRAGERAQEAGFDAVEVHGAHGYLINEFLSPHTNHRDDEYGRDKAGRARFPLEVVDGLRAALGPEFPIIYRISADEYLPDGLSVEDSAEFCVQLVEHGIDAIHVSGGTYESGHSAGGPEDALGLFVDAATAIKQAIGGAVPVAVANRIKTPEFADEIIASGKADIIATGRALLSDEAFYAKARSGQGDLIRTCLTCNHCINELQSGRSVTCIYNPLTGHETEFDLTVRADTPREVVVVGGGLAGMQAANTAAMRGHHVRLYEATAELGGHVIPGVKPPYKSEIAACITYESRCLEANRVQVSMEHPVDADFLKGLGADEIIVATGSRPILPLIPGVDCGTVATAEDVLLDRASVGDDVIIVGAGSVGVETAELLAAQGKRVTVVEMADDILQDMEPTLRAPLEARIRKTSTRFELGQKVLEIRDDEVVTDKATYGPCQTVVIAVGYEPDCDLSHDLDAAGVRHTLVGDVVKPRKIYQAVDEGFRAAYAID
ncbi:MAG TPA: NAD(P)/FAD-dependent oxidoreductase [Propionibacteriaceae bacterium]|nr:NAD(P)/FAD-dependent oxidoreductase [Propionibacteriaceae bacterium]